MPNTIITTQGLNYVNSAAGDDGPYIAIKYFLPCYDPRIDPLVHNGTTTSAIAISASIPNTDTVPTGEIIWNIDESINSYNLSLTDHYILSAGGENVTSGSPTTITGAKISKQQVVNLYNTTYLSNQFTGDSLYLSGNTWYVTNKDVVIGSNSVPTETSAGTNKYFPIVDYYPVTSGTNVRGAWKCRLNKRMGSYKFNKIALYAIQVDENGNETAEPPILFAQTCLSNPIIKTDMGSEGFDDVVIDVQIQLQSVLTTFDDIFFSTSGDYWQATVGGLYYPEKVGIGTFLESAEEPQAKLEVRDPTKQLRLTNDATHYTDIYTTSAGFLEISATNCRINTNCDIVPTVTGLYNLGSSSKFWADGYFNTLYGYSNNLHLSSSLVPTGNSMYNLGSTIRYYNTTYSTNLLSTNITTSNISLSNGLTPENQNVFIGTATFPLKTLYVSFLSNVNLNQIYITGSLMPTHANQYSIGSDILYWKDGSFNTIITNNVEPLSVFIDNQYGTGTGYGGNIGYMSYRFENAYIDCIYNNTISTKQLSVNSAFPIGTDTDRINLFNPLLHRYDTSGNNIGHIEDSLYKIKFKLINTTILDGVTTNLVSNATSITNVLFHLSIDAATTEPNYFFLNQGTSSDGMLLYFTNTNTNRYEIGNTPVDVWVTFSSSSGRIQIKNNLGINVDVYGYIMWTEA